MPSGYWFTRALWWAILVYIFLGLLVVMARIRYDRRRRLFDRIAKRVQAGASASPTRRRGFSMWVDRASLRAIEAGLADVSASMPVMRACAAHAVAHVGESALSVRASRGRGWKRIAALRTLAFAGTEATWPILDRAVEGDDPVIRRAAVITLGHIHERRSAKLLIKALRTAGKGRSHVAAFLEAWPSDISDLLWPLASDPNPILRYWGTALAGRCAPADGLAGHLIPATRDPDPSVRKAALDGLSAAGCRDAVPAVLARLDDPVPYVRSHAAQALGRLGSARFAPDLAAMLADADWRTRHAAKRALEALGRSVEVAVIEHLFDDSEFSRTGAAEVLQNLGTFERLLSEEAKGPSDPKRLLCLSKLAEVGGLRVWDAVLANLPTEVRTQVAGMIDRLEHAAGAGETGAT